MARIPNIDWDYEGAPDPIAGTGATISEQILMWVAGLSGAGFMIFLAHDGYVAWTWPANRHRRDHCLRSLRRRGGAHLNPPSASIIRR